MERRIAYAGITILLGLLVWTAVVLGAAPLQDIRIEGITCAESQHEDGATYLETDIAIEGTANARYRLVIALAAAPTAFGATVVFSDTLSGPVHAAPAFPSPGGGTLYAGAMLVPIRTADDWSDNERWALCTMLSPDSRRIP